jgi:hypothetical protein
MQTMEKQKYLGKLGINLKVNSMLINVGVELKNKLYMLSIILCIASILVLVGTEPAQSIYAGVSPGMIFEYNISSHWSSTDPTMEIPSEIALVNQTSYIEVIISEVFDTYVTTTNICYYNDNTKGVVDRGVIELDTGEVTAGYANEGDSFAAIIGANLNVGDIIHPNGDDGLKILDTTTRTYKNGDRVLNHVRIDYNEAENGFRGARDLYFDKETGILVEQNDWTEITTMYDISVTQITWKLRSVSGVNDWVILQEIATSTIIAIAIIAVIAIIVVIVLFVMRSKKK